MRKQTIESTGELLTIRELAKKLNVHCESVRRWLRKERLRGLKTGSHWRIPVEELSRVKKEGAI